MAKDTITLTMQEYNPAMYAKVQQMREIYAVLMNLKGQRLKRVTKKALYIEVQNGNVHPLRYMQDKLDSYLAKFK